MMYIMVVDRNESQAREHLKVHTALEAILVHIQPRDKEGVSTFVFRVDEDWPEQDAEMLHDLFDLFELENAPCLDVDELDIHP